MKRIAAVLLIIVLAVCSACTHTDEGGVLPKESQQSTEEEPATMESTLAPLVTPSPIAGITPEPTTMSLVLPEPTRAEPDAYIPDIVIDEAEISNTNNGLYEDEKYLYFCVSSGDSHNLYMVNKNNKKVRIITNDCADFCVSNGFAYYTTQDYKEIIRYDVKKKSRETIISTDDEIWSMASLGDQLYFSCEKFNSDEESCVLYVCDNNGEGLTKIEEDVDSFCIYNDRIFGVTYGELGDLVEYFYDRPREVLSDRPLYYDFDISLGKVVCAEFHNSERHFSNNLIYDINTGQITELAAIAPFYTLAGQYMLFVEREEGSEVVPLIAYDYIDNIEYTLCDVSTLMDSDILYGNVLNCQGNLYLRINNDDKTDLYKMAIENGKVEIDYFISVDK